MINIEKLAEWYLHRRGRFVLSRTFIGFVIGYGIAVKKATDSQYDTWEVTVPKGSRFIAMNHSQVMDGMLNENAERNDGSGTV